LYTYKSFGSALKPAEGIASVVVSIYHGKESINSQVTNPDGSFTFDKVYLKDDTFHLETQWHGVQKTADVTAELAKKGPSVLVFPRRQPSFDG
jgi:hypothetical protein